MMPTLMVSDFCARLLPGKANGAKAEAAAKVRLVLPAFASRSRRVIFADSESRLVLFIQGAPFNLRTGTPGEISKKKAPTRVSK